MRFWIYFLIFAAIAYEVVIPVGVVATAWFALSQEDKP